MAPNPIIGIGTVVNLSGYDARVIGIAKDGCTFRLLTDGRKVKVDLAVVEQNLLGCYRS